MVAGVAEPRAHGLVHELLAAHVAVEEAADVDALRVREVVRAKDAGPHVLGPALEVLPADQVEDAVLRLDRRARGGAGRQHAVLDAARRVAPLPLARAFARRAWHQLVHRLDAHRRRVRRLEEGARRLGARAVRLHGQVHRHVRLVILEHAAPAERGAALEVGTLPLEAGVPVGAVVPLDAVEHVAHREHEAGGGRRVEQGQLDAALDHERARGLDERPLRVRLGHVLGGAREAVVDADALAHAVLVHLEAVRERVGQAGGGVTADELGRAKGRAKLAAVEQQAVLATLGLLGLMEGGVQSVRAPLVATSRAAALRPGISRGSVHGARRRLLGRGEKRTDGRGVCGVLRERRLVIGVRLVRRAMRCEHCERSLGRGCIDALAAARGARGED